MSLGPSGGGCNTGNVAVPIGLASLACWSALFTWDYLRQRRRGNSLGRRHGGSEVTDVSAGAAGGGVERKRPSKLRLSAVKSNGRLLKGYGPLAALLVAFVLMAMLVPTKAPQQDVVHETQAERATPGRRRRAGDGGHGTGAGAASGRRRRGGAAARRGGGAAGAAETAAADGGRGAARQVGVVPGPDRAGARRPVLAAVHLVLGQQRRRHLAGRQRHAINVTYRITSDSESFQQTLASLGGANITDTTADIERTINALATYFDNHFQFYGRKLNIEFFNGQGSITNELLGQRPAAGRRRRRDGGPAAEHASPSSTA